MALVDKIKRSREFKVKAGGFTFTVRRPTQVEWADHVEGRDGDYGKFLRFVVDWEGVKEADMFEGGDPHPLPFDREACDEWLSDRPDLYTPIIKGIYDAVIARHGKKEEVEKN